MKQNKYILVGLFTFFLIGFTSVLILWQTDILRKVQGYSVTGEFYHIGGLLDGAVVRYRGYPVGHVTKIQPGPENIEVSFFVAKDIIIPVDSTVRILFDGLVGENYVAVEPALDKGVYIKDKAILKGQLASDLATFIDLGSQNLIHTEAILTTLKKIITDPVLISSISNIVANVDKISTDLASLTNNDRIESTLDNINNSSKSLDIFLTNLNDTESKYSLITIQKEIVELLDGLQNIENNISQISSDENTQKVSSILTNFENSSEKLSNYLGASDSNSLFSKMKSMKVNSNTKVLYDSTNQTGYFNAGLEFKLNQFSLISGLANTYGSVKFMNFQKGYQFNKYFKTRLGIINNSEGIGLDFYPFEKLAFSAQYYNFDQTNYTIGSMYKLYNDVDLALQYKNDSNFTDSSVDFGVNYQF